MFDGVLYGLAVVAHLAFAGLLLLLCIRTRSKGLMVILVTYISFVAIDAISQSLIEQYAERLIAGEIRLTESMSLGELSMSLGEVLMRSNLIKQLPRYGLNSIGLFLIYKEWKLGKFNHPQPEHREELKS